jgi:hypothetical protein
MEAKDDDTEGDTGAEEEAEELSASEEEAEEGDAGDDDPDAEGVRADAAEDEAADDSDKEQEEASDKDIPNPMIPRQRYNAVSERLKAERQKAEKLQAEIDEIRNNQNAPEQIDAKIDELMVKHAEAIKEGDAEGAAQTMRELMHLQRDSFNAEMQAQLAETKTSVKAETELDTLIDNITENLPVFDPDHESYDQGVVDEVLFDQDAYISRGMTPAAALNRAVNNAINNGLLDDFLATQDAAPADAVEQEEAPAEKKANKRKTDVNKNVDTANKQPPRTKQSGQGSEAQGSQGVDVTSMSDEEFNALPESKLRELRGDLL